MLRPGSPWDEITAAARALRDEREPTAALRIIGDSMDRLIGSRMFTFLRFDHARFEMRRLYCTRADRYPVGACKPMRRGPWFECVVDRGEVFIASGEREMLATFGDAAALAELGCTSSMCVPVRHLGRTLGTMNLNGVAGAYDEHAAAIALPFAMLAVPALLASG